MDRPLPLVAGLSIETFGLTMMILSNILMNKNLNKINYTLVLNITPNCQIVLQIIKSYQNLPPKSLNLPPNYDRLYSKAGFGVGRYATAVMLVPDNLISSSILFLNDYVVSPM